MKIFVLMCVFIIAFSSLVATQQQYEPVMEIKLF